jgi:hypothetical protein
MVNRDRETQQERRGTNDPQIVHIVPVLILYLLINIPKIVTNGLLLAISPLLACMMLLVEFLTGFKLFYHFIGKLNYGIEKGGPLLAVKNFMSPYAPITKIGVINMISTIFTAFKLTILYPIVIYLSDNELFVRQIWQNPDIFRCFDLNLSNNASFQYNRSTASTKEIHSPRLCAENELPNEFLFHVCIPTIVGFLLLATIPSGFLISYLIRKPKLDQYENVLIKPIVKTLKRCTALLCCCHISKELNEKETAVEMEKPWIW